MRHGPDRTPVPDDARPQRITGRIVDVVAGEIYPGALICAGGRLVRIERSGGTPGGPYLMPGLVDAHVHVESTLLVPSEFARLAVARGTVAVVSDPHEIANVLGIEGIRYMMDNGRTVPLRFAFGVPSCVPATPFETSGAVLDANDVARLLDDPAIPYLSEVMNFPGVIHADPEVMAKIAAAKRAGKPIDGHAPALRGEALRTYVAAGIATDHETVAFDEALEKIALGMKIIIREGSAARNFDALHPLISEHPARCMLCSDDKHPDALVRGHIDTLCRRAIALGHRPMDVIRCATLNPVAHYGLEAGLLQAGDPADFIVVEDLETFRVRETWIGGRRVAERGECLLPRRPAPVVNRFAARPVTEAAFAVPARGERVHVVEVVDGQVLTNHAVDVLTPVRGCLQADPERDILKMAVVNRYAEAAPAVAFVRRFGLRRGALASSVAHDSHNIVAVGATDEAIARAVNLIVEHRGGLAVVSDDLQEVLPLPVAGLLTDADGGEVAARYDRLDRLARSLGSTLRAPFMILSFMALLVIPDLKLSDRGLFDGRTFSFIDLFEEGADA